MPFRQAAPSDAEETAVGSPSSATPLRLGRVVLPRVGFAAQPLVGVIEAAAPLVDKIPYQGAPPVIVTGPRTPAQGRPLMLSAVSLKPRAITSGTLEAAAAAARVSGRAMR